MKPSHRYYYQDQVSRYILVMAIFCVVIIIVILVWFSVSYFISSRNQGSTLGVYTPHAWGGGDSILPTSMISDLSDYYTSSSFPSVISGTATDNVAVITVALRIQRSSDNYYWDEDVLTWVEAEAWNLVNGTNTWSWSTTNLIDNVTDGIEYVINSQAMDNSTNLEINVTDDDSQESFIYDITVPTTPSAVYDGADSTDDDSATSTSQLSANWTVSVDTTSGIQKYQYAIGSSAGAIDILAWTDNSTNTSVTKTGLSLSNGSTYYFTIRAVDNAGNPGTATNSDGITVNIVEDSITDTAEESVQNNTNSTNESTITTSTTTANNQLNTSTNQISSTDQESNNNQTSNTNNSITTATIKNDENNLDSPEVSAIVDNVNININQDNTISTLPKSLVEVSIKPSFNDKEVQSITANFHGQDYQFSDADGDGVYRVQIAAPEEKGSYVINNTINYTDKVSEEIKVNVLVDPYGYLYRLDYEDQEIRLRNVKVSLYVFQDDKWQFWDAAKFEQKNPQNTNQQGEYSFMVPVGKYYLTAEKDGYQFYQSSELVVEQGKPINLNIQLARKKINWWWLILIIIVFSIAEIEDHREYFRNKFKK